MSVNYNGYEVKVVRSKRKSVSIEVTRELCLLVRAPVQCTDSEVESILAGHSEWIARSLQKMQRKLEAHPIPTEKQKEELTRKALEILPDKVKHWSEITGLTPTKITVTGAQKQFGSCSSKRALCFSYRLMQYPDEAIDYVVLHELAHIKHPNHSKNFYAFIERYMPDYKRREALLRE